MQRKVFTIGTTTFDIFFKQDKPEEARVGGSALNTSISLARLGIPVSFITELGSDKIGDISYQFMQDNGINTSCITRYKGLSRVALAFLDHDNNAEYALYKATGSASCHNIPKINEDDIFVFGSSFSVKESNRKLLKSIIAEAHKNKAIVIYDPNFRDSQTHQNGNIKKFVEENFNQADIVKGSNEDFNNLFGITSSGETWKKLQPFNISALVFTANKNDVNIHQQKQSQRFQVPHINPKSTVGAGDNFTAGLIYGLLKNEITHESLNHIETEIWHDIAGYGISFAQEVCKSYDNYLSKDFASRFTRPKKQK